MEILIFHSYKGGSGKSIISLNIANQLSLIKKTLFIEADFNMPIFANIFKEYTPDIFLNSYFENNKNSIETYIYPSSSKSLGLIFADPQIDFSNKIFTNDFKYFSEVINKLKHDLKKLDYNYVVIDLSPGKSLLNATFIILSSHVFLISRLDTYSFIGTSNLLSEFYPTSDLIQNKIITIIFNQLPSHEDVNIILDQWCFHFNQILPIYHVFRINYSNLTSMSVAKGRLLLSVEDSTLIKLKEILAEIKL